MGGDSKESAGGNLVCWSNRDGGGAGESLPTELLILVNRI